MTSKVYYKLGAIILLVIMMFAFFRTDSAHASAGGHINADHVPQQNQRIMPIIMYHQILNSRSGDYIVSADLFERDMIELNRRGYKTVLPSEVIAFGEGKGNLPSKPIMITFDDGHYNNVFYGQEILKKHGCNAVLNIIGKYTDNTTISGDHSNPSYSHLTWDQLRDAQNSGIFEIGHHTYDMHNDHPRKGVMKKYGESDSDYRRALTEDIETLNRHLSEKSGIRPECFAYPFGRYDDAAEEIILSAGFKMILVCYEQRNMITNNEPHGLYRLCRFNRTPYASPSAFFNKMEKARVKAYVK